MKIKNFIGLLLLSVSISSCSVKPVKIEYGKDTCHYCKMTIVDKTHAAETVTLKGKVFKYDAIECMLNDLAEKDKNAFSYILVTDYLSPEKLIDAVDATYLISQQIKSPMGENLSAFEETPKGYEGSLYTWQEINEHFKNRANE